MKLYKKSQSELYFFIIQIFIVVMVFLALFAYVNSIRKDNYYEKLFITRDISLLINTLNSAQGNIYYTYEIPKTDKSRGINLSQFEFNFANQRVTITENQKEPYYYEYGENKNSSVNSIVNNPKKLEFEKSGYDFQIKDSIKPNLNLLRYPDINTQSSLTGKQIYLLSGILKIGNIDYAKDSESFSDDIKIKTAQVTSKTMPELLQQNSKIPDQQLPADKADLIVLFYNNSNEPDIFRIYIPSNPNMLQQSRKLASLLINDIMKKDISKKIDLFRIIPIESKITVPTISIDIGNNLLNDRKTVLEIKRSIESSITLYYTNEN